MSLGCCPSLMGQCCTKLRCLKKKGEYNRRHRLAGGKVQLVNKVENWDKKLSEAKYNGKTVVVKFSATWCTPCKEIAASYRELADKYSSLLFLAVDVDEMAEFCTSWDIKATPTFYFLKGGHPIDKLVGANKYDLQKKIAAIADSMDKLS